MYPASDGAAEERVVSDSSSLSSMYVLCPRVEWRVGLPRLRAGAVGAEVTVVDRAPLCDEATDDAREPLALRDPSRKRWRGGRGISARVGRGRPGLSEVSTVVMEEREEDERLRLMGGMVVCFLCFPVMPVLPVMLVVVGQSRIEMICPSRCLLCFALECLPGQSVSESNYKITITFYIQS